MLMFEVLKISNNPVFLLRTLSLCESLYAENILLKQINDYQNFAEFYLHLITQFPLKLPYSKTNKYEISIRKLTTWNYVYQLDPQHLVFFNGNYSTFYFPYFKFSR